MFIRSYVHLAVYHDAHTYAAYICCNTKWKENADCYSVKDLVSAAVDVVALPKNDNIGSIDVIEYECIDKNIEYAV